MEFSSSPLPVADGPRTIGVPPRHVTAMRGDQLERYLQRTVAKRVRVILDDDRTAILKAERAGEEEISLRLHGSFLDAPRRVLKALVRFVRMPHPHLRRRVQRLYRSAGLN